MAATRSISAPFPVYTDLDGTPLEDGYIYIGEKNQNPEIEEYQVTVYWDQELTLPAAQPIRTIGGYPSNGGTPARLYLNVEYSTTVRDKNGVFVYSSPVPTDYIDIVYPLASISDLIGFEDAEDGTSVNVQGYAAENDGGGGIFNWDASVNKNTANGVTVIDPSVSLANQGTGVGTGCWMRQYSDMIDIKWAGAQGGAVDDIDAFIRAIDTGEHISIANDNTYVLTATTSAQVKKLMQMLNRVHVFCDSVTITLPVGEHAIDETIEMRGTNIDRISFEGSLGASKTPTAVSIVSNGSGDHDVTFTVADSTGVASGDYVRISGLTSTGAGQSLEGTWKVTGTTGTTIVVKNTNQLASIGATVTDGFIQKYNSVMKWSSMSTDDAMIVYPFRGSKFDSVCFAGDGTGDTVGMLLWYGAGIEFTSSTVGFHGFSSHGLYAIYDGFASAQGVHCSAMGESGFYALNGSTFQTVSAVATGNGSKGFLCSGSFVAGSSMNLSGNTDGYFAGDGASGIAQNMTLHYNSSNGARVTEDAYIDASGASTTVVGNGTAGFRTELGGKIYGASVTVTGHTYDIYLVDDSTIFGGIAYTTSSIASTAKINDDFAAGITINGIHVDMYTATKVHNFGTVPANSQLTTTITVPGAVATDGLAFNHNSTVPNGITITASITGIDTVTVVAANYTAAGIAVSNRTYRATVIGH
jgi:hypothetical protein